MELQEAIQEFEDNAYYHSLHPIISDKALTVALRAMINLQEQTKVRKGITKVKVYCDGDVIGEAEYLPWRIGKSYQ